MDYCISDISLHDLLTSFHYPISCTGHSIAPEDIRKALDFREYRNRPPAWNELIYKLTFIRREI